jgi:poly-gamma-glutamate synthesis protein (capsule biosynthesis protein)
MKMNITLLGDIFPGNLHYTVGDGVANKFPKRDYSEWCRKISVFTKGADVTICNLEAPLLNYKDNPRNGMFMGELRFADFLNESNIKLVNIANNHIYEHGKYGFECTVNKLKGVGINYIGDKDKNVFFYSKNKIRVGFAGFNNIHNQSGILPYSKINKNQMLKKIKLFEKEKCDYKIFSIHWGDEFIQRPSLEQIKLGKFLIDNGVDIIHGHHPHVVQSIQEYKKGLIFYSLGNFIFDMIWQKTIRQGITVNIKLRKDHKINYEIIPLFINDNYLPERCESLLNNTKKKVKFFVGFDYENIYNKELKWILLKQRIIMKIFLLKKLINGKEIPLKYIYLSKKNK